MLMSTPERVKERSRGQAQTRRRQISVRETAHRPTHLQVCRNEGGKGEKKKKEEGTGKSRPATVPWTTVPFLSSTITVSFASFIKNLDHRRVDGQTRTQRCGLIFSEMKSSEERMARTDLTSFMAGRRGKEGMKGCSDGTWGERVCWSADLPKL